MIENGLMSAANVCSQSGIVSGGTNAEEAKVSGKIAMKPNAFADSGRRGEQADAGEHPRERVADQQAERDPADHLGRRGREAEADDVADDDHHGERQRVHRDVGERAPGEHRHPRHRQRAEAVDQALLQVLDEAERGREAAERHLLDDDPRDQEVGVVVVAGGLDRAAEDVDEQQREHDRLHRVGGQQVRVARDPAQSAQREDQRVADRVARGHRTTRLLVLAGLLARHRRRPRAPAACR